MDSDIQTQRTVVLGGSMAKLALRVAWLTDSVSSVVVTVVIGTVANAFVFVWLLRSCLVVVATFVAVSWHTSMTSVTLWVTLVTGFLRHAVINSVSSH